MFTYVPNPAAKNFFDIFSLNVWTLQSHQTLTGFPVGGDVFAGAGGMRGHHGDGVLGVGLQLLQDSAGLLPSDLDLFTRDMSAVRHSLAEARSHFRVTEQFIRAD